MIDGMPIVFVHGIRVSGACWVEQLSLLEDRHPVAAPDLPGHGKRRGERFTVDAAVAAVIDAIDGVGGRALVVGHSLGGFLAIATAARYPDRVAGLVPAGCTLVPSGGLDAPFRIVHRVLSRLPDRGEALQARAFRAALPGAVADPLIAAGIATEVIGDVLAAGRVLDPITELGGYPGPVRLVNGRYDHFRWQERRFLAACRQGALTVVPRAGHLLPLARGELFARLVHRQAEHAGADPDVLGG